MPDGVFGTHNAKADPQYFAGARQMRNLARGSTARGHDLTEDVAQRSISALYRLRQTRLGQFRGSMSDNNLAVHAAKLFLI
jgi:hypothetical protein